ncbi:unnamed protein product (macronuclear) [Paramecium tetraurelia]|uniref:Uncharacterized protein n=1 Tax=Paramecium tetraurelia TaxID=5888 RepID=A0CFT1_PARTE|nr:uncharacterized protein GSPATT00038089001 [Paramecium tetraurelia]CAK69648.1 unnamed protein product [Paramecium tetraurelia]|eukprot:XP_001437045.1 hypothetical protein (macronuclear) [Paramecium tetraurelia strain d4-2]
MRCKESENQIINAHLNFQSAFTLYKKEMAYTKENSKKTRNGDAKLNHYRVPILKQTKSNQKVEINAELQLFQD